MDDALIIESELERLAPRRDTGNPNWVDVAMRAGIRRSARRLLPVAALACLAVAVPAVALSSGLRSALGLGAPRPVLTKVTAVVSAPLGNGFYGHAAFAPSTTGGTCFLVTYDRSPAPQKKAHPTRWSTRYGAMCTDTPQAQMRQTSAAHPLTVQFSIQRRLKNGDPRNWVPPVVSGATYSALHARRVAIVWKGGSHALTLRDGWFIGGTPELYIPPFSKFPFAVVAYDASGKPVARQRLESPTLRLMNGWKDYARAYHAWQHKHP